MLAGVVFLVSGVSMHAVAHDAVKRRERVPRYSHVPPVGVVG